MGNSWLAPVPNTEMSCKLSWSMNSQTSIGVYKGSQGTHLLNACNYSVFQPFNCELKCALTVNCMCHHRAGGSYFRLVRAVKQPIVRKFSSLSFLRGARNRSHGVIANQYHNDPMAVDFTNLPKIM